MKNLIIFTSVIVLLTVGCSSDTRPMSGEEIYQLFADKTVAGTHEKHGFDFVSYYNYSAFRSYQNGATTPRQGNWRMEGDNICIRWQNESESLCRPIYTDDRGNYWKVRDQSQGKQVLIVTYHSFTDGNPNSL